MDNIITVHDPDGSNSTPDLKKNIAEAKASLAHAIGSKPENIVVKAAGKNARQKLKAIGEEVKGW